MDIIGPGRPPPPAVPPPSELASRRERFDARLADTLLYTVSAVPFFLACFYALDQDEVAYHILLLSALPFAALLIAQILLLGRYGQTLGKRYIGIRIVLVRDDASPGFLSAWFLRSVVPNALYRIPYAGVPLCLLDLLWIFGQERRCLHDYIAGTKVIKHRGPLPPPGAPPREKPAPPPLKRPDIPYRVIG